MLSKQQRRSVGRFGLSSCTKTRRIESESSQFNNQRLRRRKGLKNSPWEFFGVWLLPGQLPGRLHRGRRLLKEEAVEPEGRRQKKEAAVAQEGRLHPRLRAVEEGEGAEEGRRHHP